LTGYVYILQSEKTNRFYIGSTIDPIKRLKEHQSGKTKSLKRFLPVKLVFSQKYESLLIARKIELKLKKLKRKL